MIVKIKFSTGKEIELTEKELCELYPQIQVPQPLPYYPSWPQPQPLAPWPWWQPIITYSATSTDTGTIPAD